VRLPLRDLVPCCAEVSLYLAGLLSGDDEVSLVLLAPQDLLDQLRLEGADRLLALLQAIVAPLLERVGSFLPPLSVWDSMFLENHLCS